MKRKDLVIGESYKSSYHQEAIYLGTMKVLSTGGFDRGRYFGHDAGTPEDVFAVRAFSDPDEWRGQLLSLQTIECTTAQFRLRVARENAERKASQRREDDRRSKAHALEVKVEKLS